MADPARNIAVNLLVGVPEYGFDELLSQIRSSRMDLYDEVTGEFVAPSEVEKALLKLKPEPIAPGDILVYHATDAATARMLTRRGFVPETKPRPRGEGYDYQPGRGVDAGLYVGDSPATVEGYGRVILEVSVPRKLLEVPTELSSRGETDPLRALKMHDGAVINTRLPPESFRIVSASSRIRDLAAATYPVPDRPNDPGLMTLDEYLEFRNPQHKHHDSAIWDYDIMRLNHALEVEFRYTDYGRNRSGLEYVIEKGDGGYVLSHEKVPVAVLHNGTWYHSHKIRPNLLPHAYGLHPNIKELPADKTKLVKYVSEYVPLVSDISARNHRKYDHVLQHIIVKGEPLEIRSEGTRPRATLVIMNGKGEIVARATDEFGATLIAVVQEYRGKGLGPLLGKYWYDLNPTNISGGYTNEGRNNAIKMWEDRVREYMEYGWYSELVQQGKLTTQRVKEITKDLRRRPPPKPEVKPEPRAKPTPLIYVDGPTFVVYDSKWLDDPNRDYIYGYGFFRDSPGVGTFLYTIDYERPFQKLVTTVAMQMARDMGEKLYIGPEYTDVVELEGVPHLEVEGDYAFITQDVLPLSSAARLEKLTRRPKDPYGEKVALLLEDAESKWS
jgi:GNAT superfamily N-acetyltransferase